MSDLEREQVRRDAEAFLASAQVGDTVTAAMTIARHCLALLAELEQAERDVDMTTRDAENAWAREAELEAKLAKVPGLVDALTRLADQPFDNLKGESVRIAARAALTAWNND